MTTKESPITVHLSEDCQQAINELSAYTGVDRSNIMKLFCGIGIEKVSKSIGGLMPQSNNPTPTSKKSGKPQKKEEAGV